jgi:hypothetical protein
MAPGGTALRAGVYRVMTAFGLTVGATMPEADPRHGKLAEPIHFKTPLRADTKGSIGVSGSATTSRIGTSATALLPLTSPATGYGFAACHLACALFPTLLDALLTI